MYLNVENTSVGFTQFLCRDLLVKPDISQHKSLCPAVVQRCRGLPGGEMEAGRAAAALCHGLTVVALMARLAAGLAATAALNCWAVAGGSAAPTAARRPASLRSPVRAGPGQTGEPSPARARHKLKLH